MCLARKNNALERNEDPKLAVRGASGTKIPERSALLRIDERHVVEFLLGKPGASVHLIRGEGPRLIRVLNFSWTRGGHV